MYAYEGKQVVPEPMTDPNKPIVTVAVNSYDLYHRLPTYAKTGDAGADLQAVEEVTIQPGERKLVRTGLRLQIPEGYVGYIMSRSGLALKQGVVVLNAPGVIDSGYRGEIGVLLYNTDRWKEFVIDPGYRIAQLVIQRVCDALFVEGSVGDTDRGEGGFGSTGIKSHIVSKKEEDR